VQTGTAWIAGIANGFIGGKATRALSLVADLPWWAARSGLKMGLGCPLTSLFLDPVEVVH
jgi:hypothetical protein